jgi:hypothetical protein
MVAARRAVCLVPFAVCLVFSSGCLVSSLHPIYEKDGILFDEALLGAWENLETEVSASVARGEWRSYRIAFTDRYGTTRFTGHLTSIGKVRFLNVLPEDALEKAPFVVATNGFMQIEIDGARVRVREPDYTTALQRGRAGKLGVAHATDLKQNVLITAPAANLRRWLAAAVQDDALWAEWKSFTRSPR